jgi:hypothetical protein
MLRRFTLSWHRYDLVTEHRRDKRFTADPISVRFDILSVYTQFVALSIKSQYLGSMSGGGDSGGRGKGARTTVLSKKIGALNSLQAALLTFAKLGLSTSYDLMSQTGLSVGHTLPALKRLQEAGLVSAVPGPRKRMEFVLTSKGEKALQGSLTAARSNFWEIHKGNTFESASRAVFLLWVYFGKEDALRCITWATEELSIQTRKKQREADEILHDLNRLQAINLFGEDPAWHEGLLLGKTYQYLKASSDATLLKMQAVAAEQLASLLDKLPSSFQKLTFVDRSMSNRPD